MQPADCNSSSRPTAHSLCENWFWCKTPISQLRMQTSFQHLRTREQFVFLFGAGRCWCWQNKIGQTSDSISVIFFLSIYSSSSSSLIITAHNERCHRSNISKSYLNRNSLRIKICCYWCLNSWNFLSYHRRVDSLSFLSILCILHRPNMEGRKRERERRAFEW